MAHPGVMGIKHEIITIRCRVSKFDQSQFSDFNSYATFIINIQEDLSIFKSSWADFLNRKSSVPLKS